MTKLFTSHDPNRIHATFGFINIVHMFYRVNVIFKDKLPEAGFGQNLYEDLLCLVLMALPNITSFILPVPVMKKVDGFHIWQEYRWHALIFVARSWLMIGLYVYEQHFQPDGLKYDFFYRLGAVYMTMYLAQTVTNLYPKQTSTIRGMYKSSIGSSVVGLLQFMATALLLVGPKKNFISTNYIAVAVIQLNAFNMTLRKKRKIGAKTSQMYYTVMLVLSFYLLFWRQIRHDIPTSLFDERFRYYHLAVIAYSYRRFGHFDRFTTWILGLSTYEILMGKVVGLQTQFF